MSKPLLKDLQELVNAKVLTADTADQIILYYRNKKDAPSEKFNIILAILGALLVGSGVVLLVAHNWDEMSQPVQTIFAFLPLAVGQGLCIFTLLRKKESTAWRESSSVILFFAVASCIALVSQVYHISGSLQGFILTWLLLTAPMVYIMRSSLTSLLVIACATWYAVLVGYRGVFSYRHTDLPYFYVLFLLFLGPHYYWYLKSNRDSNFFNLHNWSLVVSTIIGLGAFASKSGDAFQWVFIGYCSLFGVFYLIGESDYFRQNRLFANPFLIAGVLGTIVIFLVWSYEGLWSELHETSFRSGGVSRSIFFYISLFAMLVQVYLFIRWRKQLGPEYNPMGISVFVLAICVLAFPGVPFMGLIIVNAWVLIIAMFYIRKGAQKNHLGILNLGLLIIAALALLRFFDESIPFVWRGLFFVATGVGFIVANYLLLKKRKSLT